ncbi:MAG: Asp-tRNA(Asn)/Glu-tRNA(Gln) amidotransferase subunit GatA [Rickettsiales bacterium]|nr:Asp-tRNA(Asn)/Glu-tRNA(Gln) amidotransferase subunit GatA [Rickettsiales bacterium]
MELTKLTLLEAKKGLEDKKFSSVELTEACISNIEKDRKLNAFITETFDLARERAILSDKKISEGKNIGKLEGIPLAIKDIFCTNGVRTTAGSKVLENFIPPYESTVTKILHDEGYVMLGKTNCAEFAADATNKTSFFGACNNPYKAKNDDRDLIPGGSSGGSAVAVAANMCFGSTGSDTGGSIRQPVAMCNLVGLKPTYGRISRYGMVAYASSLDQAGFLTKDVRDCAYLTHLVCGKDEKDSTTAEHDLPNFLEKLNSNIKGKKVGIIKEFNNYLDEIESDIKEKYLKAIELLKHSGAEVIEVSIPTITASSLLYTVLSYTELGSNLARYTGVRYGKKTDEKCETYEDVFVKSRTEGFGKNIKKRILLGYYLSSSENYEKYFIKSQKIRRKIANEFDEAFKKVDIIFTPTDAGIAFPINPTAEENKIISKRGIINDYFINAVNMCGLPGISVPYGFSKTGLPIGMQFIGKLFDEQSTLDFALFIEENK